MEDKLKLAILTGQDSAATCQTISMLADLPEVEIVSILADVEPLPLRSRLRNLKRNVLREGIGYVGYRLLEFAREAGERLAQRLVSREEVSNLLQESFPECPRSLADLGRQRNIRILRVGNLNRAVTHADLGLCSYEQATYEVVRSKKDLEEYLHCIISLFSYPYGEKKNIRDEVMELIRQSGYEALFSAYGGYFDSKSDVYDVPRWSVSSRFRPLDLLMEVEGLSISAFKRRWRAALPRRGKVEKRAIQVRLRERREMTDNKRA
jgi:hypothetical protein